MEKVKYFVIARNPKWQIVSDLFENRDDAMRIYNEISPTIPAKVCETIYG